jgi:hypothetical protein
MQLRRNLREENEMYELAEYGQLRPQRENGREAATVREDHETSLYVVRDLSWLRALDRKTASIYAYIISTSAQPPHPI